jgi:aminoglycoside phosphotransferase (APT) family kinase protein
MDKKTENDNLIRAIPGLGTCTIIEPITKGWSEDKKYCVTKADGTKVLLRVSAMERYETRKSLFTMLERVAALGVPMCLPIAFGTCADRLRYGNKTAFILYLSNTDK